MRKRKNVRKDRWEERMAKHILEDQFAIGPLEKRESPDLQGDGIGIEITMAYPSWYTKMRMPVSDRQENDTDLLLEALRRKTQKLNSDPYDVFLTQGLFVFALLDLGEQDLDHIKNALKAENDILSERYDFTFDFVVICNGRQGQATIISL